MYHFHFSTPTTSRTIERTKRLSVATWRHSQPAAAPSCASTSPRARSMSRTGLISGFFFTRRAYHIT